jgi:tetratricopeptide (TPR) repeat protein
MQPRKIAITTLITLFATTTAFTSNGPVPFFARAALAQTPLTHNPEAYRLIEQGNQQYKTSEFQAAIQSWQQALTLYQKIGERPGEAIALINLGHAYFSLGEYQKALEFYQQSLVIQQEMKERSGEANALSHLGEVYRLLGQYQKAIEFYQQSLSLIREISQSAKTDHYALLQQEATSLSNLGNAYRNLGQYKIAIEFDEQSLVLLQKMSESPNSDTFAILKEKANSLTNLGHIYFYQGNYKKAIECYEQSLAVVREIGDRQGEANTLGGLGNIYYSSERYQNGMKIYQQSLAIARGIGDRTSEGIVLNNLGALLAQHNQPELAIIFYKQSVNIREAIRRDIQGLPKEQQQSYTETIANTYRSLADLLLKQDRVLEAQRVLDLLKVQELEDYLHDVRASENLGNGIADRAPEQQIKKGYEAILNKAIEQGKELAQLEGIPISNRTEAQGQRVIELRKNQGQITQQFQEFLKSPEVAALLAQLRQTTGGEGFDLENYATLLQNSLKQLQQDAVILYPFVLEERLELVLVTSYAPPIRRTVAVKREDLNRAIIEFRNTLKNPSLDAKNSAQKLYNLLIKPIANDLAQAKAKTIIYAPDGQLRYIPLAALYNGNQWLVQSFGINNITALSLTELNTIPQKKLHILAGVQFPGTKICRS